MPYDMLYMIRSGTISVVHYLYVSIIHVSIEIGESRIQKCGSMISQGFRSGDLSLHKKHNVSIEFYLSQMEWETSRKPQK